MSKSTIFLRQLFLFDFYNLNSSNFVDKIKQKSRCWWATVNTTTIFRFTTIFKLKLIFLESTSLLRFSQGFINFSISPFQGVLKNFPNVRQLRVVFAECNYLPVTPVLESKHCFLGQVIKIILLHLKCYFLPFKGHFCPRHSRGLSSVFYSFFWYLFPIFLFLLFSFDFSFFYFFLFSWLLYLM